MHCCYIVNFCPTSREVFYTGILSSLPCQPMGCDGIPYTGNKYDRCRVCKGDSSTCAKTVGNYTDPCEGWGKYDTGGGDIVLAGYSNTA